MGHETATLAEARAMLDL
ncbi:MAG TPA: hypothetical protein VKN63_01855 [Afifellaceae bacterium]|nr:hypothetical protein [Afifellaceae bacterium]